MRCRCVIHSESTTFQGARSLQVRALVETAVSESKGPSFDQRLAESVERKQAALDAAEELQWREIRGAHDRGRAASVEYYSFLRAPEVHAGCSRLLRWCEVLQGSREGTKMGLCQTV